MVVGSWGLLDQRVMRCVVRLQLYNMLKGSSLLPDTQTTDPEEQFQLLDMLGQGAYGSVSKALHIATGNLYAIKILSAASLSQINAIKKQIQILKLCDNKYIVKYYGSYFKDNSLWIILEYCHAGSIIDLINITQRKLSEHQIASILESVIEGLIYLHGNKKIHRDIKAANILLNNDGIAKLADFGVSTQSMYTNAGHKSQVGSPYWMSPEVMKHNQYTNKTDIWSLGVTAIELAEGVVPNSHLKPLIAMWQLKDKPVQGFKNPQKWSPQYNSFINDCLNINPSSRPQAKTLLKHPFIVKFSKGQRLLAELVQQSLADIQQFRLGQDKSHDSQSDLMNILNASGIGLQTKTIVNNPTQRSRQSREPGKSLSNDYGESSMIVNDFGESSMIVNENDNSLIADNRQKPTNNFLNNYINNMRSDDNEGIKQKEELKKKILNFDNLCLAELEELFMKHKTKIKSILLDGITEEQFALDLTFIEKQFQSKLLNTDNIKEFVSMYSKYKDVKEFQRSQLGKKKSQFSEMAHHSTQTNDPGYTDLSQFRQGYPRGVKSQQFNQKQFKTNEKHCFNSKSIISDIENVKYSKDYTPEDLISTKNQRLNKRLIVTQPYEWTSGQQTQIQYTDKLKLKEQFLLDPDVKQSLLKHMQTNNHEVTNPFKFEGNGIKYDRVAESTLYHEFEEQIVKHQNSTTILKPNQYLNKINYSDQEYLLLNEEFQEDDDININLFNTKNNANNKLVKHSDPKKKNKHFKRLANSSEKKVVNNGQRAPVIYKKSQK